MSAEERYSQMTVLPEVLPVSYADIYFCICKIEEVACKYKVSQFKSHIVRQRFLRNYSRDLFERYRLLMTMNPTPDEVESFCKTWSVENATTLIKLAAKQKAASFFTRTPAVATLAEIKQAAFAKKLAIAIHAAAASAGAYSSEVWYWADSNKVRVRLTRCDDTNRLTDFESVLRKSTRNVKGVRLESVTQLANIYQVELIRR